VIFKKIFEFFNQNYELNFYEATLMIYCYGFL